jgi:GNAT superfamily N-acetyltransferase
VHLRVAGIHDAEAITAVINLAFRVAESFLMERDRMDLESVQSLLQSGKFLLADHGGAVAGCIYVELKGERAYLGLLSVDPKQQKTGVGSMLMNAAEDYCGKAGCRFMDLQVINVRQELPSFYRNRGYVETGTAPLTPGLRPKLPCHFVTMSKQLT